MNLYGKVVVITGASRGLGKALALNFAQEDTKVALIARSKEEIEKIAKEIDGFAIICDITDQDKVRDASLNIVRNLGKIDIWINNAGIWLPKAPIDDINSNRLKELFDVNVFGLIYGSKEAYLQMKEQRNGTIVNILSTIALGASEVEAAYCASKWAANGFTQSLRLAAQPNNIKVLTVFPGGMKTNFFDEAKPDVYGDFMDPDSVAKKIIDNIKADKPEEELVIRRPKKCKRCHSEADFSAEESPKSN